MKLAQKIILCSILSVMFAAAGIHAYHDCTDISDPASQALIQCNINPVNGQSLEVK